MWVTRPVLIGAVALMAVLFTTCRGGGGDSTATPTGESPTPSPTPEGVPTATPLPPPEPTSYRFLYSEFGGEEDIVWSIAPADPADRVQVAAIPHKSGWGIKAALSPDGAKIAYNAMPEQGLLANTDAETYVLDLKSGETRLVAQRIDLRTAPLWSPDGALLFLRRDVGEDVTVILVQLSLPGQEDEGEDEDEPPPIRTVLRQHVSDVLVYAPLGFDAEEGTLYFVQIQGGTESGSYLGSYAPATGEAVATATAVVATATAIAEATATAIMDATATAAAGIPTPTPTPTPEASPTPTPSPTPIPTPVLTGSVFLFLSDQFARDHVLSPDASRVAFLDPGLVEGQFVTRVQIADIKKKEVSPLPSEGLSAGDQLSPVWHPDGDKVSVGQLPEGANPGRVATVPLGGGEVTFLLPPEQGFDQPLSWSPDGKFLAVTSFPGESLGNPGSPRLVFVAPSGQRLPAPEGAEIQAIGWVAAD